MLSEVVQARATMSCQERAGVLISQVSDYFFQHFPREAFLLALCAGGMRVKDVLTLSFSEISADLDEELSRSVRHVGSVFDTICNRSGISFGMARMAYLEWANARSRSTTSKTPAFFSRKHGRNLTCRSAERCISSAAQELGLQKWLTLGEARLLSRDVTPGRAQPSRILEFGDQADWLLRRSLSRQCDFEDAKQELLLRLRKWETESGRAIDRPGLTKFVVQLARGVKNEIVLPRRSLPIMLLPHYDWVAAPSQESEAIEQVGLGEVHAARFRRFQARFLASFSGIERQAVALLFGLAYGRPYSVWQVARILKIPASAVCAIERKAQKKATAMSRRIRVLMSERRRSHKRSLAWHMEQGSRHKEEKSARPPGIEEVRERLHSL